MPPLLKYGFLAVFAGALAYMSMFGGGARPAPTDVPVDPPIEVSVPILDTRILAQAKDKTREERLVIEPEPLRHLLEIAIDVSPAKAIAIGMPENQVPVAEVRQRIAELRGRWLWFKGELEELNGPREGHPVKGNSIYEATIRLPNDERAICEFSLPPDAALQLGSFVRIEGYLMKLRDTTYPRAIDRAPFLVGRGIQRDYADWGPVTALDPQVMAAVEDKDEYPGSQMWRDVEADQDTPLWHLAAYARDTAATRTLADWRKFVSLNIADTYDQFKQDKVARGQPMRVLGTLYVLDWVVAPPNPAGIRYWTQAFVQVRDFGGFLIPIWIPRKVTKEQVPLRTDVEVRGLFYRWHKYVTRENLKPRVPLFVAADIDPLVLESEGTMRTVALVIGIAIGALMLSLMFVQLRARRSADRHSRDMDLRRRKNRERAARLADAGGSPAPPQP